MPPLSEATRQLLWNVPHVWPLYAMLVAALAVLAWSVYERVEFWRRGKSDDERLSDLVERLFFMLGELFSQRKVRQKPFPGLIHVFLFYSFIVLVITTTVVALDYDFHTSLFRGYIYVALTVGSEIGGVLVLFALLVALWRRHVRRPAALGATLSDTWAFLLLALVIITGFVVEGLRVAVAGDPWSKLSFVGLAFSLPFAGLGVGTGATLHASAWWLHAVLVFVWIATIPHTKFFHLLTLPANAFFSKRKPAGELARVDLDALVESEDFDEESFSIGVDTTNDLTWKQRLDGDACVECGRCDEACPALAAGQPLSPKKLIVSVRDLVHTRDAHQGEADESGEIVGSAFDEDFVWYCLTCMACVQACPAFITHVDTFVEIRRNEVSMKGRADTDVSRTVRSMEVQGNPFGSQITRGEWVKSLGVRVLEEGQACDVLYWVGCLTTFDEQKRQIAEDLIGVLRQCNVDFALLGKAEVCCGDPARVCGAESVFQSTAKTHVEALNRRTFNTLLVSCPHCYNTLKNEYPQFGGKYKVVHHSELLRDLLRSGELQAAKKHNGTVVYHDPCYLGRYQGIFDAPRDVLRTASGVALVEMEKSRQKSFCCGGGGGHFWMETKEGKRIDTLRIQQAKATQAGTVVTACPYCFHMLTDATKTMNLEKEIRVVDLVSHVVGR
jgi:Fe-S oxidoreductase/nitrate reductase gamma subunit